jgi:3-oxoacyl-[acyl-carrier protein] reductase
VDYSTAKAAVIGFTKALAQEVEPYGIKVNCIAPGAVSTERLTSRVEKSRRENPQSTHMDINKMATPAEIAEVVLFLVTDDVPHLSGDTIIVNAGGFR